jgi:hypothetical protein
MASSSATGTGSQVGSTYGTSTSSSSQALQWAQLVAELYQANRKPKAPSFATPPMSPEQRKLYDAYYESLQNPALKNNAAEVNSQVDQILDGYKNLSWTSPKTFSGDVGYSGSSTHTTPHVGNGFPDGGYAPDGNRRASPGSPAAMGFPNQHGGAGSVNRNPMNNDIRLDETIPGARSPETSANRNVGMSGDLRSVQPRGADGSYRPTYGDGHGSTIQMGSWATGAHATDPASNPTLGLREQARSMWDAAHDYINSHPGVINDLLKIGGVIAGVAGSGGLSLTLTGAYYINNLIHHGSQPAGTTPTGGKP